MIITFLGTRGFVDEYSRIHKNRSSLLIESDNKRLLIDFGDLYKPEQFPECDVVLITHAHPDHSHGLAKNRVLVYLTKRSFNDLLKGNIELENVKFVVPRKDYRIGTLLFEFFPIFHSVKYPAYGIFFELEGKRIGYFPDICAFRTSKERDRILSGLDLYIGDGSTITKDLIRRHKETGEIFGHAKIQTQVKWCEKNQVPIAIFTHFGKEAVEKDERELEALLQGYSEKVKVLVAKDGFSYQIMETIEPIRKEVIVGLPEPKVGLILVEPHGSLLISGAKKAIVKSKKFEKYLNEPVYLFERERCLGIIQLGYPLEMNWEQFKSSYPLHLVTEEEARKWRWKEPLFFYPVTILKTFVPPLTVEIPKGPQVWVKDFKLKQLESLSIVYDIENKEERWRELIADHRYCHIWYARGRKTLDITHKGDEVPIPKVHAMIVDALRQLYFPMLPATKNGNKVELDRLSMKFEKTKAPSKEDLPEWERKRKELFEKGILKQEEELPPKDFPKDLADVEPNRLKLLSEQSLKAWHNWLHVLYRRHGLFEDLIHAHTFVWLEFKRRGLKHPIVDKLDEESRWYVIEYPLPPVGMLTYETLTSEDLDNLRLALEASGIKEPSSEITLDEILQFLPDEVPFEEKVFLTGRIVNLTQVDLKEQDIDVVIVSRPNEVLARKVKALFPAWLRRHIHLVFSPAPLIGFNIPLYSNGKAQFKH